MKTKVLTVLVLGFVSQLIVSCCDCGDTFTFENIYTDVTVIAYDNSGFSPRIATDTVYKNAFGLGILVNFETKIAENNVKSGLMFSSAMATSCDCSGHNYIYPDPISYFTIFMIDPLSGQKTTITDCFRIKGYNDDFLELEDFFAQRQEWRDGFQVELAAHDSISDSVIFSVEVFLESGKSFTGQTAVVNFY